ncbi:glycoside hydrolase family 19 protein [Collimonas fungivorans]|nr:glycoside hydrolase family 19 protein [Collimonas fungivorans]ACF05803.1 lytic protein [Collimonas fungivorans Ter331]
MPAISQNQLASLLGTAADNPRVTVWLDPINAAFTEWSIGTPHRQAAFLAQILHESAQFKYLSENLNYSAARLRQVWPRRFPTDGSALKYASNPEKLANNIYADRLGNGDEASGDGWKYRGRGLIQLTGRDNYERCGKALELDLLAQPELLQEPAGAARSAAWYWASTGLNELADLKPDGNAREDFVKICQRVNGGNVGLQSRLDYWDKAMQILALK